MFTHIGKTLKVFAIILMSLGIVASSIFGVLGFFETGGISALYMLIGYVISVILAFVPYGIGQAIENTEDILNELSGIRRELAKLDVNIKKDTPKENNPEKTTETPPVKNIASRLEAGDFVECKKCGHRQLKGRLTCSFCGAVIK